ncbi:MAG: Hpt domain-containing protein [Deltaproteobacteria bacterium]|nr:Hpt domain-containing protein [Deltaproteobacteria bacterium]
MLKKNAEILRSFLIDADRLWYEGDQYVKKLAKIKQIHPQALLSFFQIIHSLKGTASMIPDARSIVQVLQRLEATLSCQSSEKSSQSLLWLDRDDVNFPSLDSFSNDFTKNMYKSYKQTIKEPFFCQTLSDRGLLVAMVANKEEFLSWFPLSNVKFVITQMEIAGRQIMNINGAWVPVIGELYPGTEPCAFGICVCFHTGIAIILVQSIVGLCSWGQAQEREILLGLNLFEDKQKNHSEKNTYLKTL